MRVDAQEKSGHSESESECGVPRSSGLGGMPSSNRLKAELQIPLKCGSGNLLSWCVGTADEDENE
jgi:hypothetical protein